MNGPCILHRVVAKAVSSRHLTTMFQVRSHLSPCEICGGWSGAQTGFSPSSSVPLVGIIPPLLCSHISLIYQLPSLNNPLKICSFPTKNIIAFSYNSEKRSDYFPQVEAFVLDTAYLLWSGAQTDFWSFVSCCAEWGWCFDSWRFDSWPFDRIPHFIVTAWLLKLKGVRSFETSRINNLLFSVILQRLGYGNLRLLKVPSCKIFVTWNWSVTRCKNVQMNIHVEIKCQLDATDDFIADLIACSTCFGQHYAHHQELESIIQVVVACDIWCFGFQVVGMVWSWGLCVRFVGCCCSYICTPTLDLRGLL